MDRLLSDTPDGDDVVTIDSDAGESVGLGAIAKVVVRLDGACSVGVRLGAVLHHENDRKTITGGQAGGFVPEAERGKSVIGQCYDDVGHGEIAIGERDSGGKVELSREGRRLRRDVHRFRARLEGGGPLFATKEIGEDLPQRCATNDVGCELGLRRRKAVTGLQSDESADLGGFAAEDGHRRSGPRPWTSNFGLGCGLALASIMVMPVEIECLLWGQTAMILLLFVVLDTFAVKGKGRGVFVGLATAFKIYPVVFIVVWIWRRQYREAAMAAITASLAGALAWILWPASFSTFVRVLIIGHEEFGRFANGGAASYASSSVTSFFMRAPFHIGLLNWAWDGHLLDPGYRIRTLRRSTTLEDGL